MVSPDRSTIEVARACTRSWPSSMLELKSVYFARRETTTAICLSLTCLLKLAASLYIASELGDWDDVVIAIPVHDRAAALRYASMTSL